MNELPFEKVRRFAWVAKRLSKAGSYLQAQLPFTSQLPRTECAQLYTSFHLMSSSGHVRMYLPAGEFGEDEVNGPIHLQKIIPGDRNFRRGQVADAHNKSKL